MFRLKWLLSALCLALTGLLLAAPVPRSGILFIGPLKGHTGTVWTVAWSPDGKRIVSGSGDKTLRIWDVEKEIARAKGK